MDKVDKDIKDISKNLQIKNIIKLDAMASDQASLAVYESVEFYKPETIYLNQLNIFDSRQLYPDTSLASYIKEDPVFIKEQQLKNLLIWRKRRWKKISTEIKGDIRESLVGIKAFKSRPDMVIHLASYPRAKIIQSNPVEGISQVVDGTVNMLWHAAKFGAKKFVYVSSSMVYGHFKDGTKENAKTKPINMYGEAKLTGERLTKLWCTNNNLDYAIVRPSGVYGPGDLPDRVISKFFDAAMTNQDLQVHGNNKVDFTYRKDAAQGIIDVAFSEHKNTSFNITAGKSHTLKETAKLIVKICKSKSKISYVWSIKQ